MADLAVLSLTPAARRWLAASTAARVLSTFDRACNLVNQDNAILTLVTSERRLTPFAMVVGGDDPTPFQAVSETSAVTVSVEQLLVGSLSVRIETSNVWDPVPDWKAIHQTFAEHPTRLRELAQMVVELSLDGSLLGLYTPDPAHVAGLERAVRDRAWRGAVDLVRGLVIGMDQRINIGVKLLAGLGMGLTPAGDDFLVGVLLALWAGLYGEGRAEFAAAIAKGAAPLTTTLSAAYLHAAANGECLAYWHILFAAVRVGDAEVMRMAAKSLMTIGHTSGADGLAGFLAVYYLGEQTL